MHIEIKQIENELYSAKFLIERNHEKVGELSIQGWMGGIDGNWDIVYKDVHLTMEPVQYQQFKEIEPNAFKPYRPQIIMRKEEIIGYLYDTQADKGFLKNMLGNETSYRKIMYRNDTYNSYAMSPGKKEGGKNCIYNALEEQIALVEWPVEVYDGLYNLHVIAKDDDAILIAILNLCMGYVYSGFHPGEKIKKGYQKFYGVTFDKFLLSKYDPNFKIMYDD